MKIIHLSDIHIGYRNLSEKFSEIVERMIIHKRPCSGYIVIITGDIVQSALRKRNFITAQTLLNRLRKAGFTLLIVPGNHDYGTGCLGNKRYKRVYNKYILNEEDASFPRLHIIDNTAFIGLDSMADELHWYDRAFAQGELGDVQLKKLEDMLSDEKIKRCKYRLLYLHHHPLHTKIGEKLKDSKKLKGIIKNKKIDAVLFGHKHEAKVWNGCWGIKRFYDAGTSTAKKGKPSPHRIMDLGKEPSTDYDARF